MSVVRFLSYLVCISIFATSITKATELNGRPRVIDGDTIEVSGQQVRLHGIDTPETKQECRKGGGAAYKCGAMATFALAELIEEHWVKCVGDGNDRYNRLVATCFAGPVNLNMEMVRRGWALAYRQYSKRYIAVEAEARTRLVGLWQGTFIKPWEWRRGGRLKPLNSLSAPNSTAEAQRPNCMIKGNISRSGNRIYHLPKSRHYENTRIDAAKGERWFCSESEAERAGWRAPR
jgi:endonuclease YncB( thermonuclease family)